MADSPQGWVSGTAVRARRTPSRLPIGGGAKRQLLHLKTVVRRRQKPNVRIKKKIAGKSLQ